MIAKPVESIVTAHLQLPGEGNGEYRVRIAREKAEREAHHQQELKQQAATHNTPYQRIRWWEHLHALTLPRTSNHPLLQVVANQTGLSLEQVRDEQTRRSIAAATV